MITIRTACWPVATITGTLLLASVLAAGGADKPALRPAPPQPPATAPKPRLRFGKWPICMCGAGPTEKDIEAAQRRLDQDSNPVRTPRPQRHNDREKIK